LYIEDKSGRLKEHFTGTGIQHFTGESLDRYSIPVPQPDAIRKYVDQFEQLAKEVQILEVKYQQKLTLLNELKTSLLQRAFAEAL
jgi:type I restriction enzyme S subunit